MGNLYSAHRCTLQLSLTILIPEHVKVEDAPPGQTATSDSLRHPSFVLQRSANRSSNFTVLHGSGRKGAVATKSASTKAVMPRPLLGR